MILTFPTGFFISVIPHKPSDSGNVTWTISNSDPPRAEGLFIKLPSGQESRTRPPKIYSDIVRRQSVGDLIYTVATNEYAAITSARKLFEAGQVLDFTDVDNTTSGIIRGSTPDIIEVQHNTNLLDLNDLGLSALDIISVSRQADAMKLDIERQLTAKKIQLDTTKGKIVDNQKKTNEANKAINALSAILATNDPIIVRLKATLDVLVSDNKLLVIYSNSLSNDIDKLYSQLLTISQLVR